MQQPKRSKSREGRERKRTLESVVGDSTEVTTTAQTETAASPSEPATPAAAEAKAPTQEAVPTVTTTPAKAAEPSGETAATAAEEGATASPSAAPTAADQVQAPAPPSAAASDVPAAAPTLVIAALAPEPSEPVEEEVVVVVAQPPVVVETPSVQPQPCIAATTEPPMAEAKTAEVAKPQQQRPTLSGDSVKQTPRRKPSQATCKAASTRSSPAAQSPVGRARASSEGAKEQTQTAPANKFTSPLRPLQPSNVAQAKADASTQAPAAPPAHIRKRRITKTHVEPMPVPFRVRANPDKENSLLELADQIADERQVGQRRKEQSKVRSCACCVCTRVRRGATAFVR